MLPYLSVKEKELLAKNIFVLLKKRGGVWITPDISNSDRMKRIVETFPSVAVTNKKLSEAVGRDMRANSIGGGNREAALEFYRNLGFRITKYKAFDLINNLVELEKIEDESLKYKLREIFTESAVWVLEVN